MWLAALGPGVLIAATGVGAGDLATAGFAGSHLGLAIAWAVVVGAFVKFVLNEGLARWQLATGSTVLEGALTRMGRGVQAVFIVYLIAWTYFVAGALMNAAGVATASLYAPGLAFEVGGLAIGDKHVFGAGLSVVCMVLVWVGGYKLFERVMAVAVVVMVLSALVTAVAVRPDVGALVRGLVVPSIPDADGDGLGWTVALMGGVGGTLTIICYAYWAREDGRTSPSDLRICRIDLASGYTITALFGVAMVVIASGLEFESGSRGTGLLVELGGRCGEALGPWARWVFLIGAWCAIVSSMLGVWQAVPYVFADVLRIVRRSGRDVSVRSGAYRWYLVALGTLPMVALFTRFEQAQKVYAVVGAGFIPALAGALLYLCNRREMGALRNGVLANGVLVVSIVLAVVAGVFEVLKKIS